MTTTLVDAVSFFAASSGGGDFVFGTERDSFLTPAQAVTLGTLADGDLVPYLAQDDPSAPTQREWGHATFHAFTSSFTRTTVYGWVNNGIEGSGTPLNFDAAPMVSLIALAEDLIGLGGMLVAGSDLNFYVSTTGSDSNPGTITQPFATIQHAANVAATYNYQGLYFPTINVEAGTFSTANSIILPELTATLNNQGGVVVGAGVSNTTVEHSVVTGIDTTNSVFFTDGNFSVWTIEDLTTDHGGYHFFALGSSTLNLGSTISVQDSAVSDQALIFGCDTAGNIAVNFVTLNINIPAFIDFWQGFRLPAFSAFASTMVWPSGPYPACIISELIDTQFNNVGTAAFAWTTMTNVNAGGLQESQIALISQSGGDVFLTTDNGAISDLPGTGLFASPFDNTCYLLSGNSSTAGVGVQGFTIAALSSELLLNTWFFGKDTNAPNGAGIRTMLNDAGVVFTVGSGAPYKTSAPLTGGTVTSSYGLRSNIVNPAGTLAALTVNLPTGVIDGDITRISFTQAITALTIATTDSSTVVGAPTTALSGSAFQFLYSSTGPTWWIN